MIHLTISIATLLAVFGFAIHIARGAGRSPWFALWLFVPVYGLWVFVVTIIKSKNRIGREAMWKDEEDGEALT